MKILMICGTFPPAHCGVGDYSYLLAENISQLGIEVDVLTSTDCVPKSSCVNVLNFIDDWGSKESIKNIIKIATNGNYDIIHIQWPTNRYFGCRRLILLPVVLRMRRKKVVLTLHEYNDCTLNYKIGRIPAIIACNHIIVVDANFLSHIRRIPFIKNKISVVEISSNIPNSKLLPDQVNDLRKKIVCGDEKCKIISHFGFINKSKCIEIVIEMLGKVKKNCDFNFKYLLLTELTDSEEHLNIKKMITKYGLEDNVIITGFLSDELIANYLKVSDLAILLFRNGVSPRNGSFLAAVEQGIKVITTGPQLKTNYPMNNVLYCSNNVEELYKMTVSVLKDNIYEYPEPSTIPAFKDVALEHLKIYSLLSDKNN